MSSRTRVLSRFLVKTLIAMSEGFEKLNNTCIDINECSQSMCIGACRNISAKNATILKVVLIAFCEDGFTRPYEPWYGCFDIR